MANANNNHDRDDAVKTAAAIKMDELLVNWLGSDAVYHNVLEWIEHCKNKEETALQHSNVVSQIKSLSSVVKNPPTNDSTTCTTFSTPTAASTTASPTNRTTSRRHNTTTPPHAVSLHIPPFYPIGQQFKVRRLLPPRPSDASWDGDGGVGQTAQQIFLETVVTDSTTTTTTTNSSSGLGLDSFVRITKEVCRFPSYFNGLLYQRILDICQAGGTMDDQASTNSTTVTAAAPPPVTFDMFHTFWMQEMEHFDTNDRFFRLIKQRDAEAIVRDDFLPILKALLTDHPGLEFLSSHEEFQEKYAVSVVTRIFYYVDRSHAGKISARELRHSDLVEVFQLVDEEEDINKVARYFSYEHFYVLYCRFWEIDHDRDYRITREDLLKYGDHALSHMVVDRIFDAAPRPFSPDPVNRDFMSFEDFIYFMFSEEDKANEVSIRYWFSCVDVDGDGKLNNMEMRSFYAVQLHRMQCLGHEIIPFEDMLCQMMDMIKPGHPEYLVVEDFLQKECASVSGALFDALFNLNKHICFEQRDPFVERQKREDEFNTDWERFACFDYNRLAMEEEAREEEAMEIDWVTVEDEEDDDSAAGGGARNAAAAQQTPAIEGPF